MQKSIQLFFKIVVIIAAIIIGSYYLSQNNLASSPTPSAPIGSSSIAP